MREISFDEVGSYWSKCSTPVMVYVHSPFCENVCSYCVYNGTSGVATNTENRYFEEYLPRQIKKYYQILDKLNIHSMYFGGGTPNHKGQISQLRPAIEALRPYIYKGLEEMTIELHMGYEVTRDQIHTIKEWGFTTVILCVQTFDIDVLKTKNRLCRFSSSDDYARHIDEVSSWCHEEGLQVGMDLMCFLDMDSSYSVMEKDLTYIHSMSNLPDEVTIAPVYQNRTGENFSKTYDLLFTGLTDLYDIESSRNVTSYVKVIRFFKKGISAERLYTFKKFLDDGDSPSWNNSCLGIGSYKNKNKGVYSNINSIYTIVESCDDPSDEPCYILTREVSFWDKCRNVIDFFERECEYRNPPVNFTVSIKNSPSKDNFHISEDDSVYFEYSSCFNEELGTKLSSKIRSMTEEDIKLMELEGV